MLYIHVYIIYIHMKPEYFPLCMFSLLPDSCRLGQLPVRPTASLCPTPRLEVGVWTPDSKFPTSCPTLSTGQNYHINIQPPTIVKSAETALHLARAGRNKITNTLLA